ncbi:MAG: hypothetical protein AAF462_00945 [Thermodesulfobacteriota bacterium]
MINVRVLRSLVVFLSLLVILGMVACPPGGIKGDGETTDGTDTTSTDDGTDTTDPGDTEVDCSEGCNPAQGPWPMELASEDIVDGNKVCTYTATVTGTDCCNGNRITIIGEDPQPSEVTVQRENSGQDFGPDTTNQITSGWETTTSAGNCTSAGCANGEYTTTITVPQDSDCPDDVHLAILLL